MKFILSNFFIYYIVYLLCPIDIFFDRIKNILKNDIIQFNLFYCFIICLLSKMYYLSIVSD
uniref:Uncharacterized protein orf60b n=1 Tax=Chara vulgaris TaxID=55564 RepID=Q1ACI2_CHAVU|nr:hypothetical protein ChvuCp062 [Chara vulgaris]ABA61995.1 hypothetical protein [Chara vulgaris]